MNSPVETFTDAERARLAPHFTNLDRPVFALTNLPETVKGALFARYSRYPGTLRRLFLDEFAESLAGGAGDLRRRRRRARREALRDDLPGLRRRLGRPARRGAHRLRVGVQRPDQGAAAPAPGGLPGAVDPLHRLRRADARRRLPLPPRSCPGPGVRARDGRDLRDLRRHAAARHRLGRRELRRRRRRPRVPAPSRRRRWTCCAASCRPRRCRTWGSSPGPDLRAAHPAPAGPPVPRGARRRHGDPRRA